MRSRVRRRREDHHREGDREHERADGSGEPRRLRALPIHDGRHFRCPASPVTAAPCIPTVGIGRQKIRRFGPPNLIGAFPPSAPCAQVTALKPPSTSPMILPWYWAPRGALACPSTPVELGV